MIKAGVIGHPISHSLSPVIHGYWLKKYNIDGQYAAHDVAPEDLENFIKNVGELDGNFEKFSGINVTLPHKEKVMEFLDEITQEAKIIGAVNTVTVRDDKKIGENTDSIGFIENIKAGAPDVVNAKEVVVLGAGGAAKAIVRGLLTNINISNLYLLNRTRERAEDLKGHSGEFASKIRVTDWSEINNILEKADLLVNTTSLGMVGKEPLEINLEKLPASAIVTDIVYNPLETELLKQARKRGNKTVDGLGMLLHQAAPGFEAWFGVKPEVDEDLRNAVLQGLAK